MSESPKVSLIIVNWNSWQHMEGCLASLQRLEYSNLEIVVVDNASSDDSADKVEAFEPKVTLIRNKENLGSAGGNNVGMRYALDHGTDYVWLLNSDAEPEPNSLSLLVAAAEADPKAGVVAPILYDFHNRGNVQNCGATLNWDICRIDQMTDPVEIGKADPLSYWVWATAVVISRKVLETIGLYDEKYFVYCDDMDLSIRANRAGFINKTVTEASVYHKSHYSGDERKLPMHYYFYMVRNLYFFWRKFLPWHKRGSYFRKYLSQEICHMDEFQKKGDTDVADVYCDSLYCILVNRGDAWVKDFKMPKWMKSFLIRHPYIIVELLDLRFDKIMAGFFKNKKKTAKA